MLDEKHLRELFTGKILVFNDIGMGDPGACQAALVGTVAGLTHLAWLPMSVETLRL